MNKEKIKGTNHGIWKNLYKNLGGCYYLFRMQTLSIQLCKKRDSKTESIFMKQLMNQRPHNQ